MSLGGLVRPSSGRFLARISLGVFLELDKVDSGFGNGFGGSARRMDSGRYVGRGVLGDDGLLGSAFSWMEMFSVISFLEVGSVFGCSVSMIPLFLDDLACKLRRTSRSLRLCFVAASFLLYISH